MEDVTARTALTETATAEMTMAKTATAGEMGMALDTAATGRTAG